MHSFLYSFSRLPSGLLPTGLSCMNEDGARIVGGTEAQRNTWRWFVHIPQVKLSICNIKLYY